MAYGTVNVHISRSAGDVFAVIADVSKNTRWSLSAVEGRQTSPGPVGVGTTAREVSTFLGRRIEVDSEVTEFIVDQRLAYRTNGGPFPFSGSFDVTAEGDGARLAATFEATPAGGFAFLGPLFARLVRRALQRDLARLKRLMDGGEL
ncbi:MAG: SRPBCC family protein [Acidimicrobiia bacterium]|nr:SRPBCC family protein [Acidimicrobiia bacterium]